MQPSEWLVEVIKSTTCNACKLKINCYCISRSQLLFPQDKFWYSLLLAKIHLKLESSQISVFTLKKNRIWKSPTGAHSPFNFNHVCNISVHKHLFKHPIFLLLSDFETISKNDESIKCYPTRRVARVSLKFFSIKRLLNKKKSSFYCGTKIKLVTNIVRTRFEIHNKNS